jgi:hypothetical protein
LAEDLDKILSGKELTASPLLLTPVSHPQLVSATNPAADSTPAANVIPISAHSNHVAQSPAKISTPLPSLASSSVSHAKSMIVVMAACITLALAVITMVISSQSQNSQPPVATGGLPGSSSPTTTGR